MADPSVETHAEFEEYSSTILNLSSAKNKTLVKSPYFQGAFALA